MFSILFQPPMLFINNMIEKALLIKIFAPHIGHSTAVYGVAVFIVMYTFYFVSTKL